MKISTSRFSPPILVVGTIALLATLSLGFPAASVAAPTQVAPAASWTNSVSSPATNAAPKPTDSNDDDDDASGGKHSFKLNINTKDEPSDSGLLAEFVDDLIPLAGIAATFGTPILIVFFISYFRFRRRRENLALAREFLNKGLPVPLELLDPSQRAVNLSISKGGSDGPSCDLRKGFRLTFIGLGLAVAFYVTSPQSTMWGWGFIPMIMGIGFLISGWVGTRRNSTSENTSATAPPPNSRNLP